MLLRILADPRLGVILSDIDFDLAEEVRAGGCPYCGGRLHSARYPRKPRCGKELGREWRWRESLCCAAEGCRRRTTPASVRFLGPRVYPGVVVVLVTALCQGATGRRLASLRAALGIDRRTLERWRKWWRESFPATRFWNVARARFVEAPDRRALPRSLVVRFKAQSLERIVSLLRFLSPLSTRGAPLALCEGSYESAEDARHGT